MAPSDRPPYGEWQRISLLHYVAKLQSFPRSWKHRFYRRWFDGAWVYTEAPGAPPPVLVSSQDRRKAKLRYKGNNRRRRWG